MPDRILAAPRGPGDSRRGQRSAFTIPDSSAVPGGSNHRRTSPLDISGDLMAAPRAQAMGDSRGNYRRLRVSGRRYLAEAVFATGIPFLGRGTNNDHALFSRELQNIMAVSAGVRRFGSAALDLAYVAAGRFDGFWEHGLKNWDIAAGILLVREAGGFVSDFASRDRVMHSGDVVAANPSLHAELLKHLAKARN